MAASREAEAPSEFLRALDSLHAARPRPEVVLTEVPAPQRLAPFATAMSAEVTAVGTVDDDQELATGRLVLLHDPAGQESWRGTFRFVTFARAELEPEIATDPMLSSVGWSWLIEALESHGAGFTASSGTVTRVVSEGFGGLAERPASTQIEIRASWTPTGPDFGRHLEAWCTLLCTTAGLPPAHPGVASMPRQSPRTR
jgi:Protein of unknown function (DUF3000)